MDAIKVIDSIAYSESYFSYYSNTLIGIVRQVCASLALFRQEEFLSLGKSKREVILESLGKKYKTYIMTLGPIE